MMVVMITVYVVRAGSPTGHNVSAAFCIKRSISFPSPDSSAAAPSPWGVLTAPLPDLEADATSNQCNVCVFLRTCTIVCACVCIEMCCAQKHCSVVDGSIKKLVLELTAEFEEAT